MGYFEDAEYSLATGEPSKNPHHQPTRSAAKPEMPRIYRRRSYRPRTYRRKAPYGSRRPTRRFAVKKRAYRKKTTSGNFRKRILNTTSRKKQDTMSPATVSPTAITPDVTDGPIAFNASDGIQVGLWCATQRSRDTGTPDVPGRVDEPATAQQRSASCADSVSVH